MKIAVLGATGPTGVEVVKQALELGYSVTAMVRNTEKMAALVQHDNLQVKEIDLTKETSLSECMRGQDAVLSSLGSRGGMFTPCSIYTDSMPVITAAMRSAGLTRLVSVTSWGAKDEPGLPFIISWILKPLFLRHVLANMGEMEDYVTDKCQDINYTIVRPPGLTNGPSSGKEVQTREGQYVETSSQLPRADLAKFMLACLKTDAWDKKMVAIGVPR